MENDMVTPLVAKFEEVINSLLEDFEKFRDDEHALAFLAQRTRNFIGTTRLTLSNIIFAFLGKLSSDEVNFDEEINKSKMIVETLFDKLNDYVNHILEHENDDEDAHHDCCHEHHIHVDVDDVQGDIDNIIVYLGILRNVLVDISSFVLSFLKYDSGDIVLDMFKKEYEDFSAKVNRYADDISEN